MGDITIRQAISDDYSQVINVIDAWWGGRRMADMLPKLFFVHFQSTCFIAEKSGVLLGFLVGFVSQSIPEEAYIHFVGISPEFRGQELGRTLYEQFFDSVKKMGVHTVRCVTSPINRGSIAFHLRMGFHTHPGNRETDGVPVIEGYDGRGEDRVLFSKTI